MAWLVVNERQRQAVEEVFRTQEPRVIVIVGCAILEDALKEAIQGQLRKDHPKEIRRLFKGPLTHIVWMSTRSIIKTPTLTAIGSN